jgi:16S rRNA (cytidine1402-2'-O)-methyltransferase
MIKYAIMANLYIVATPIGNLEDVSKRALRVLGEVDLILCEDTRNTQKLLNHFDIKTSTLSYHQHSKLKKIDYILKKIKEGKNLALVSDAGTPGVSDPGNKLIGEVIKEFGDSIKIVPIPGPSALISAVSISGFSMQKFSFFGFPPQKRKRKKFFEEVLKSKYPVIFYESPYRIIKTLNELRIMNNELNIIVCRELTKVFETTYRGKIEEVLSKIKKDKVKGEFVVIVNK